MPPSSASTRHCKPLYANDGGRACSARARFTRPQPRQVVPTEETTLPPRPPERLRRLRPSPPMTLRREREIHAQVVQHARVQTNVCTRSLGGKRHLRQRHPRPSGGACIPPDAMHHLAYLSAAVSKCVVCPRIGGLRGGFGHECGGAHARSRMRTSENTYSTHFVNKGKEDRSLERCPGPLCTYQLDGARRSLRPTYSLPLEYFCTDPTPHEHERSRQYR